MESGVKSMARVYADLVRKGLYELEDVPEHLREDVRVILDNNQN